MPFGSVKEATSIPLLPSLSLSSTVGSVTTVYHGEESDLRDETHHVDVNMDSMREGADDMSELQRCESSMSVLTCYSSAEVEDYVKIPVVIFKLNKRETSSNLHPKYHIKTFF